MKKRILYIILASFGIMLALASCGKKMNPLRADYFTATPSPLELRASKVPVRIDGRLPHEWFDKKTTVVITPILFHMEGEVSGPDYTYQGEEIMGNGITIPYKTGGNITMQANFDYVPAMKQSELFLRFQLYKNGKRIEGFHDIKIADGVIDTEYLASAVTTTPSYASDAFQQIIKETHDADIMFMIQRAELRSGELNSRNMKAWQDVVQEAEKNNRKKVDVEVMAYASPDGGYKLNEELAGQRERATSGYLRHEFRQQGLDTEVNAKYTAQDWEGFQKLVQASSLQDKDLVLRVLSMYSDPVAREREIKNISAIYSDLAETILPQLRRSRLLANVEIIGKSDQEIKNVVNAGATAMKELSVEELLYAATLDGMPVEAIYTQVTQQYPNDYRGWNNLGAYQYSKAQKAKATQNFSKARNMTSDASEPKANLGLLALADNDIARAEQLLGSASGASGLNESLGLLYLKKGEYSRAEQLFVDTKTNNAVLSQILTKNYSKAQRTLNDISNKDATTYYLAAIVAARTNNTSGVVSNLKSSMSAGKQLSEISLDPEFAKYLSNPEVMSMLTR